MKKRIIIGILCLIMLISVVIVDINADPDAQEHEDIGQYPTLLCGEFKQRDGQYACVGPSSKCDCTITLYF